MHLKKKLFSNEVGWRRGRFCKLKNFMNELEWPTDPKLPFKIGFFSICISKCIFVEILSNFIAASELLCTSKSSSVSHELVAHTNAIDCQWLMDRHLIYFSLWSCWAYEGCWQKNINIRSDVCTVQAYENKKEHAGWMKTSFHVRTDSNSWNW